MARALFISLLLAFLHIGSSLKAQQLPLYTQYVFNPYLINPSMVGFKERTEVNILYRRQWTQIQDGPKTMQLDVQVPLQRRMAIGFNLYNDQSVLLSSTSALFTYGYKVPLTKDQSLGFGLSAGIFQNRINLSEVAKADANDPALLSAASNNMAMNGQFGFHYSNRDFIFGFAFTNLIQRKTFSAESFQSVKFGQLGNQIYFASYRFRIDPVSWSVQPNISYRLSQDNINFWEASALISYLNRIDLGGGYRQNFGPTMLLRVRLERLEIGASYDFPSATPLVSAGGTQEFQLKWRMHADNSAKIPKKIKTQTQESEKNQLPPIKKEETKKQTEAEVVQEKKDEPVSKKVELKEEIEPKKEEIREEQKIEPVQEKMPLPVNNFFFVIGSFELQEHAEQFVQTMRQKGISATILESKPGIKPHFFYVHMPQYSTNQDVSPDKLNELKKSTGIQDAWFIKMD